MVTAMRRVGLVCVLVLAASCRRDEARREAERATEAAEKIAEAVSETTVTAAEIPGREEHLDTLRIEHDEYRRKLRGALDALDHEAKQHARRGAGHTKVIAGRRETLKHHLDAIDRSTREDWAALKAKIDRDLDTEAAGGRR